LPRLLWGAETRPCRWRWASSGAAVCPAAGWSCCTKAAHTAYYEAAADFNAVLCDFLAGSLGRHQAPGVEYR